LIHTPFTIWCAVLTIVVVTVAVITDLLWRRIPNILTIPAFVLAVVVRVFFQGWTGFGLALAGAVAAPVLLLLMHGGKGIGMGDLKLAASIGAILGPVMAVVAVLLSAIVGGVLAIAVMSRPGGQMAGLVSVLSIGIPFVKKKKGKVAPDEGRPSTGTIPYGLAIGAGSLLTLAVYWWTGNENWFLSFVGIAGNR
jgi:prepilin peptidase CpaA